MGAKNNTRRVYMGRRSVRFGGLALLAGLALTAAVPACGGGDDGGGGTPSATGMKLYTNNCLICHGTTGAGLLGPNITGSTTAGIGSWTYAQFVAAVRTGVDDEGKQLCADMTRFPATQINDADLKAIHDFVISTVDNTANAGL